MNLDFENPEVNNLKVNDLQISQLMDDMPISVVVCNQEGEIQYFNKNFKLTISDNFNFFESHESYEEYKRFCKLLFYKEFQARPIELPIVGVNGIKKWYRLKGHLARFDSQVDNAIIVFKDITEEKKLSSQLYYSETKLKTVLASELIVLFSIDKAGNILNFEGEPLRKLEIVKEDYIGFNVFEKLQEDHLHLNIITACISGSTQHVMIKLKNRFFDVIMFPDFESIDQGPYNITGMAIDVTDRENSRESLDMHKEALVRASKLAALGEMASGISHEINNPLTVIYGYMCSFREMIKSREINFEESEKIISDVISTSERIEKIIDGLRIFSREGGNEDFQITSINEIISGTLVFCEQRIKNNGVKLNISDFNQEIFVNARAVQISEILLNLLNNAFDAVADTKDPWISIEWKIENRQLKVSVINSGTKIDEKIISKLFQPFFTTKPEGMGTGLGLSISKGLAQANNGNLQLDLFHTNTKFDLILPLYT